MKVFVAGATGTLGRPVVRTLVAHGHEAIGLSRSPEGAQSIQAMGAHGVTGNALDADRMKALIVDAKPDVVLHLLTALPPGGVLTKKQLRPTNALRTEGTANLIRGATAAGVRRFVAESFLGVYGSGQHPSLLTEDAPLAPAPEGAFRDAVLALRSMEDQLRSAREVAGLETVALRFGLFYGPDVPSTRSMIDQARAGRLFVPRGMKGVASFVHIDDAAAAVVAAVERSAVDAVYNIADDRPMTLADFLSTLATSAGARPPRVVPAWLVRLAAPVVADMGSARLPLSNAKAKRDLAWSPQHPRLAA